MSIIAVEGLNLKISLYQVVKMLAKCIQGHFKALNFEISDRGLYKTCYLQLSDKLDPVQVVEKINNVSHGKKKSILSAYIPESVPDFSGSPRKLGNKQMNSAEEAKCSKVLSHAQMEILTELQYKYTGLYNLSSKGSHTLLEAIGMTIHDRLKQLVASGDEDATDSFKLTARYRKMHPHFGDFQLILGTLHRLEDAAGAPRTQLLEPELMVTPKDVSVIYKIPYKQAQEAVSKYTQRILKKLEEHIDGYDLTTSPEDSPEDAARKKVQAQLTKLVPYLPNMMKQVVTNHFAEDHRRNRYHKMRMYGEPYLVGKELTLPLLRRVAAQRVARYKTMFNMLVFDVPMDNYAKIMAHDGTNLGGSKIIIRSSGVPIYRGKEARQRVADEELDFAMDEC